VKVAHLRQFIAYNYIRNPGHWLFLKYLKSPPAGGPEEKVLKKCGLLPVTHGRTPWGRSMVTIPT
jgi:hypothetical protein